MKSTLKIMLLLAIFFASTFVVINATGIVSSEKIELWLRTAHHSANLTTAAVIILLLFADLFIAIPTLTVTLLGGYFLGPVIGSLSAIVGLSLAGISGYGLSLRYGDTLLRFLIKDSHKREEATSTFKQYSAPVILLSRATPILPEVTACMAGISRMRFSKFLMLWMTSAIPYATIASYAGSISTLENPKPAIYAVIGLTTFFWGAWLVLRYSLNKKTSV